MSNDPIGHDRSTELYLRGALFFGFFARALLTGFVSSLAAAASLDV